MKQAEIEKILKKKHGNKIKLTFSGFGFTIKDINGQEKMVPYGHIKSLSCNDDVLAITFESSETYIVDLITGYMDIVTLSPELAIKLYRQGLIVISTN